MAPIPCRTCQKCVEACFPFELCKEAAFTTLWLENGRAVSSQTLGSLKLDGPDRQGPGFPSVPGRGAPGPFSALPSRPQGPAEGVDTAVPLGPMCRKLGLCFEHMTPPVST